jgi:hypothetical protein
LVGPSPFVYSPTPSLLQPVYVYPSIATYHTRLVYASVVHLLLMATVQP